MKIILIPAWGLNSTYFNRAADGRRRRVHLTKQHTVASMAFCPSLFSRRKSTTSYETTKPLPPTPRVPSIDIQATEIELGMIPLALMDYYEGDCDEKAVETLISSRRVSVECSELSTTDASETDATKFTGNFSLSIPRADWVNRVLAETHRQRSAENSPHLLETDRSSGNASTLIRCASSGSGVDPERHSNSPSSSLLSRSLQSVPNGRRFSSPENDPTDRQTEVDDTYWQEVAFNMLTFKLGLHPSNPSARVGSGILADFKVASVEAAFAMEQIVASAKKWAIRAASVRDAEVSKMRRRGSLSTTVPMLVSNNASPPNTPKSFLTPEENDTELRPFVGESNCGVPLMRLALLRCKESSMRTAGICVHGLIVVHVEFADIVSHLKETYTMCIVKDLVKALIPHYDFIRLSTQFRADHPVITGDLIQQGIMSLYQGSDPHKQRVIRYSNRRFLKFPSYNALPVVDATTGASR